jgi:hypothetical protein
MDTEAKRSKAGRVRHSSMLVSYASASSVHSGSQLQRGTAGGAGKCVCTGGGAS